MRGIEDRLVPRSGKPRPSPPLNHPSIVQVYSVEESDGVHFIAMERDFAGVAALLAAVALTASLAATLGARPIDSVEALRDE
jgi:hypothetical protein